LERAQRRLVVARDDHTMAQDLPTKQRGCLVDVDDVNRLAHGLLELELEGASLHQRHRTERRDREVHVFRGSR
jgi:hypothetical protein